MTKSTDPIYAIYALPFVPFADPLTFLNQDRRKATPPAAEPKKGKLRLRETAPEQAAQEKHEALVRAEYMRLVSPPENARMLRDELGRRAEEAVRAA